MKDDEYQVTTWVNPNETVLVEMVPRKVTAREWLQREKKRIGGGARVKKYKGDGKKYEGCLCLVRPTKEIDFKEE